MVALGSCRGSVAAELARGPFLRLSAKAGAYLGLIGVRANTDLKKQFGLHYKIKRKHTERGAYALWHGWDAFYHEKGLLHFHRDSQAGFPEVPAPLRALTRESVALA